MNYLWMGVAAIAFGYLLFRDAPYGRHVRPVWGPTVDNRFGWVVMEFTVIVSFLTFFTWNGWPSSGIVTFFAGCFLLHYVNRSLVYPFRLHTTGKRMPIVIMLSAMTFNTVNGFLLGYYFAHFADYPPNWSRTAPFIAGLLLFLIGMVINWSADNSLIHLRQPDETNYRIPRGGLFNRISCPNHFGEILEWAGFSIMTLCLPAFTFLVWTAANLIPRALAHHRWYRSHFTDYPTERKAIIPYLF